eukprot:CAMPEP_0171813706 /NCGR_PEP_ID=MMETSP0991-20121206/79359_1 /TAXON_ID=483369 /ORGANISM="non described non described, Strain CCMP2098" /LENGTH=388 /DNA_ID=CAMNT_0012427307 /DNA_START=55 /DNA_END=1221 /DNA_ORIENTATION=+
MHSVGVRYLCTFVAIVDIHGLIPRPPPPTRRIESAIVHNSPELLPVGVDEAGTGAIAGPIIAAAVWLAPDFSEEFDAMGAGSDDPTDGQRGPIRLHDSKILSSFERSELFLRFRASPQLLWATGAIPASRVDEVGVPKANGEAIALAVRRLERKLVASSTKTTQNLLLSSQPQEVHAAFPGESGTSVQLHDPLKLWVLVDGDSMPEGLSCRFQKNSTIADSPSMAENGVSAPLLTTSLVGGSAIVGGDKTELCIAAASIFAKVCRDACCASSHRRSPHWGFDKHKGYGTPGHLERIAAKGVCLGVHRVSGSPFARRHGQRANIAKTRLLSEKIHRQFVQHQRKHGVLDSGGSAGGDKKEAEEMAVGGQLGIIIHPSASSKRRNRYRGR